MSTMRAPEDLNLILAEAAIDSDVETPADLFAKPSGNGRVRSVHRLSQHPKPQSKLLDRMPHSLESERSTLASILLDSSKLVDVAGILRPGDFFGEAHQKLFGHLQAMEADGIDTVTLVDRLREAGDLEAVGGTGYLDELLQSVPVANHAVHYAKIVARNAASRRAIHDAAEIIRRAHAGESPESLRSAFMLAVERCEEGSLEPLFPVKSLAELSQEDLSVCFLVDRVFAEGFPLWIGGPTKSLKTTILVALGVALATGKRFLDFFDVPQAARIAILSAESGKAALVDIGGRIAETTGFRVSDVTGLYIGEDIPRIDNPEHETAIRQLIRDRELAVLGFDPMYLGADEDSQSNQARAGQQYRRLAKVCLEQGCTPVFCGHTTKHAFSKREPLDITDLHGAGTAEFVRQWWLVNRREDYQHNGKHALWLSVGASYGHGGLWGLDIDEGVWDGPGSRYWDVSVLEGREIREAKAGAKQEARETARRERLDTAKKAICRVLAKSPKGEVKTRIRDHAGLNDRDFNPALSELLDEGKVIPCEVFRGNRKKPYQAYKLAE